MYRRNILHISYPVAFLLGLFILYHAWIKPTHLLAPAPDQPTAPTGHAQDGSTDPQRADLRAPEPQQTRLIDTSGAPNTKHRELLDAIRHDIETGNVREAETKLADLPETLATDKATRPYLAILWNNLGIQQEKTGGTSLSVKAFKHAASLDGKNSVVQLNLAHAYWELRDPAMTQDFLEKLTLLAPSEPFPHLALANLFQERNQLGDAARHLDHATARASNDPAVQSYLQTVADKVRRTEKSDAGLASRDSTHFTVKFNGESDQETWITALEILEEAYREIGQKFGHFPSKTIVVVLHAAATFQGETDSPLWADGLFDPVLGRIQIPMQGALTNRAWLTRVLRHEFVHALLRDQQGQAGSAVPTWLNEGLAMELSGGHWSDLDQVTKREFTPIPLLTLEGSWGRLSPDAAILAYLEAHSAVHYLIDRFGMHQMHELLTHLKARQTFSAAIQSQLSLSYEQLQTQWMEQLQKQGKHR